MVTLSEFKTITNTFSELNIIVIGDIFIDKLIFGNIKSILTEYPVPELHELNTEYICGAASNVAVNLSKLKCNNVYMIGIVGNDYDGQWILNQLKNEYNINTDYIVIDNHFHTMSYTKIYNNYGDGNINNTNTNTNNNTNKSSLPQCIMAINRNNKNNLNINKQLIEKQVINKLVKITKNKISTNQINGIIICDQIASLISPNIIQNINKIKQLYPNIFIMADSRSQIGLFHQNNIKLDLIKANSDEIAKFTGININLNTLQCDNINSDAINIDLKSENDNDTITKNINKLYDYTQKYIMITCSKYGLMLYNKYNKVNKQIYLSLKQCKCDHEAMNISDIKDVTGCGDCVTALICLLFCNNINMNSKHVLSDFQSGYLCNILGSLATRILGTSQISLKEFFIEFIKTQYLNDSKIIKEKDFDIIVKYINLLRDLAVGKTGQTGQTGQTEIVYTNGYFDLLHSSHLSLLKGAKKLGKMLIVGINTNYNYKSNKINKKKYSNIRPIHDIFERMTMLSHIDYVDYILPFSDSNCIKHLKYLQPDIWVKGSDYNINTICEKEKKIVFGYGGKLRFVKTKSFHTTWIIDNILSGVTGVMMNNDIDEKKENSSQMHMHCKTNVKKLNCDPENHDD